MCFKHIVYVMVDPKHSLRNNIAFFFNLPLSNKCWNVPFSMTLGFQTRKCKISHINEQTIECMYYYATPNLIFKSKYRIQ